MKVGRGEGQGADANHVRGVSRVGDDGFGNVLSTHEPVCVDIELVPGQSKVGARYMDDSDSAAIPPPKGTHSP